MVKFRYMPRRRWVLGLDIVLSLSLLLALAGTASAQTPEDPVPAAWRVISGDGPWVVRILGADRTAADDLARRIDVWRRDTRGVVEAAVGSREIQELLAEGFHLELDEAQTRTVARLGIPLPSQGSGIPGFPCYRTVEETYATAEAIVAAHPDLATWTDIGDSWEKTQDPGAGWDLYVLKLTQSAISGPKPSLFAHFAIHAREYTTAELGTRFAEMLVDGYGTDPDITWLLDYHEVHLVLQGNPDGRKRAETGLLWRKNTDNDYCSNTNNRGADLNRNFAFEWGCCGGSSGSQCSSSYRGPTAASEPEIQALQDYASQLFPDQRGPDLSDPARPDATGVAIDVHASGQLVLWPWGFTNDPSPNATALATFGRKLGYFNGYTPIEINDLTTADGDSADHYYGELGVAGMAYELGTQFFESCPFFESNIVPLNLPSLLYAAKVARTPYLTPAGPEAFDAATTPPVVVAGELVRLSATVDDTRFNQSSGAEPTQTIAGAEAFLDLPPWEPGALPLAMSASDGTFDEGAEAVEMTIDTTGFAPGRHLLFVRATDTAGNEGVVAAAFLDIECLDDSDCTAIFADGFESGDLSAWSGAVP